MILVFASVAAYLLGSIPTGHILAKRRGIDLRNVGSGNIGATNVLRAAGKNAALFTLAVDILKGAASVMMGRFFFPGKIYEQGIIGLCAILGHIFSPFLKFRGGKGVATSIGVLSVYSPQTGLLTIIIWVMVFAVTKYSSLGALVSFGLMPGIIFLLDRREKVPVALLITLLLFVRHAENIKRLAAGKEHKTGGTS